MGGIHAGRVSPPYPIAIWTADPSHLAAGTEQEGRERIETEVLAANERS